jgi:hypothetical protein
MRTIHHADALSWLKDPLNDQPSASFITSLPDFTEFPRLTLDEWKSWFISAASLVLNACPDEGVAIFYQRDSKLDGIWVDKGYLIQKAAEAMGHAQVWHKIICRAPPGYTTYGRPAYSHLICFSKTLRLETGNASADVIAQAGKTTWTRGMGENACRIAVEFVQKNTQSKCIVDPFCGHGLVLAVANEMGMEAIGVEIGRKRAERARLTTTKKKLPENFRELTKPEA